MSENRKRIREQITLALLGNPGFFTHGLPSFGDTKSAAEWLGDPDLDKGDVGSDIKISQRVLAFYTDGLVDEIISINGF